MRAAMPLVKVATVALESRNQKVIGHPIDFESWEQNAHRTF